MTDHPTVFVAELYDEDTGERQQFWVHATREGAREEAEVAAGPEGEIEIHEKRLWGGPMGRVEIVEADR